VATWRKNPRMRNRLNRADQAVLWACAVCGANYVDGPLGRDAHQAATGHAPVADRPLCPVMGVE
jgi:hypothetical protein